MSNIPTRLYTRPAPPPIHLTLGAGRSARARCRCTSDRIAELAENARATQEPQVRVSHGGSVANAYRYPASTEGRVEVVFPDGSSVTWLTELPANKVTLSGVLSNCGLDHTWCDNRYSAENQRRGRRAIVHAAMRALANHLLAVKAAA